MRVTEGGSLSKDEQMDWTIRVLQEGETEAAVTQLQGGCWASSRCHQAPGPKTLPPATETWTEDRLQVHRQSIIITCVSVLCCAGPFPALMGHVTLDRPDTHRETSLIKTRFTRPGLQTARGNPCRQSPAQRCTASLNRRMLFTESQRRRFKPNEHTVLTTYILNNNNINNNSYFCLTIISRCFNNTYMMSG